MDIKVNTEVMQNEMSFKIRPTGVHRQRSRNPFPEDGDDDDDDIDNSLELRSRTHPKPRSYGSPRSSSSVESGCRTLLTPNRRSLQCQSDEYTPTSSTKGARQRQSFFHKAERRQRRSSPFGRKDSPSIQFHNRDSSNATVATHSSSGSRSSAEESPEPPYGFDSPSKSKNKLHGTELPPHPSRSSGRGYRSRHESVVFTQHSLMGSPLDTIRSLSPPPRRASPVLNFCRSPIGKKGGRIHVRAMAMVGIGLIATLTVALIFVAVIKLHYNSEPHASSATRLFLPPKEAIRSVIQADDYSDVVVGRTPGSLRTKEKATKKNNAILSAATSETKSTFKPSPMEGFWKNERIVSVDPNMYWHGIVGRVSKHPRVLVVSKDHHDLSRPISREVELYPAEFSDNTQLYSVLDSSDEALSLMELREPYSNDECVPMQDWQTTYHPSCNGMHETNLIRLNDADTNGDMKLFGTNGYWRNAWRLDLLGDHYSPNNRDTIVLKTLKFNHTFEDAHFEHDRIDAIAMERLTSSPHVINIFGFCGHSVFTEYADGPRLGTLADKSKKTPLKRLEIARDVATGLADVHGIDGDGNATFVHLDINPANVVVIGKSLKLNDFNIGIPLKWNKTSITQCGFPAQYPNPQWRSPEEANNSQHLSEKVDVFSMGHIFFRMICGHEPWNKLEAGGKPPPEEITNKVRSGKIPHIPDEILNSDDHEVQIIRDAMLECYTVDPERRPSARFIANFLDEKLQYLTKKRQIKTQ